MSVSPAWGAPLDQLAGSDQFELVGELPVHVSDPLDAAELEGLDDVVVVDPDTTAPADPPARIAGTAAITSARMTLTLRALFRARCLLAVTTPARLSHSLGPHPPTAAAPGLFHESRAELVTQDDVRVAVSTASKRWSGCLSAITEGGE